MRRPPLFLLGQKPKDEVSARAVQLAASSTPNGGDVSSDLAAAARAGTAVENVAPADAVAVDLARVAPSVVSAGSAGVDAPAPGGGNDMPEDVAAEAARADRAWRLLREGSAAIEVLNVPSVGDGKRLPQSAVQSQASLASAMQAAHQGVVHGSAGSSAAAAATDASFMHLEPSAHRSRSIPQYQQAPQFQQQLSSPTSDAAFSSSLPPAASAAVVVDDALSGGPAHPVAAKQPPSLQPPPAPPALLAHNLCKVFKGPKGQPDHHAVSELSLVIERNECFGLCGPSGGGKTTTLLMLQGAWISAH